MSERRTILIKRGTADEWAQHDDVLADGELGALMQDGPDVLKIGDGSTPFSALPPLGGDSDGGSSVTLPLARTDLATDVQASLDDADSASQPGHTHAAVDISDATAVGKALMTAATPDAAQSAMGAVPTSRAVSAGAGLTGGGDLSADRTVALSAASITSLGRADTAVQPAGLTKAAVGLGSVDNTSDASKPVSTAQASALAAKADLVGGVVPTSQIPALAITDVFPVASQAAMLALTAQRGDVAIRSDVNATYILAADNPAVLANWTVLPTPAGGGGAVSTVNGQTGTVVLGKADIGLSNVDNTSDASKPVSTAQASALALKAPLASPAFTGSPTAPTQTAGDSSTKVATTAFVAAATAATTRVASYTFGGCETTDADWAGATVMTQRARFKLTVQPTRYRVHARNASKLTDTAATTTSLTSLAAWVGLRNTATNWDASGTMQQVAAGSTSVITGATEWVSGWTTPTTDMTKQSLFDIQFAMPANTNLAYSNATRGIIIGANKGGSTAAVGTTVSDGSNFSTVWQDLYCGVLEIWIEYEYAGASAPRQGLVIGHSFADNCSYMPTGTGNSWDGANSGYPQLAARRSNQAVTVDAVGSARTATYAPSSPKWNLFATNTFDWVAIGLAENDITNDVPLATIQANMLAIIAKVNTLWPKARVFVANVMANKPQDTSTAHETARVAYNAWLNQIIGTNVDGMLDYERALGLTTDLTTLDPRTIDTNPNVSLRHLSNYGAALAAAATDIR